MLNISGKISSTHKQFPFKLWPSNRGGSEQQKSYVMVELTLNSIVMRMAGAECERVRTKPKT